MSGSSASLVAGMLSTRFSAPATQRFNPSVHWAKDPWTLSHFDPWKLHLQLPGVFVFYLNIGEIFCHKNLPGKLESFLSMVPLFSTDQKDFTQRVFSLEKMTVYLGRLLVIKKFLSSVFSGKKLLLLGKHESDWW